MYNAEKDKHDIQRCYPLSKLDPSDLGGEAPKTVNILLKRKLSRSTNSTALFVDISQLRSSRLSYWKTIDYRIILKLLCIIRIVSTWKG